MTGEPILGEVIFEMVRIGAYAKMTATDVSRNIEVSVTGPATGAVEALKHTALAKLRRRIAEAEKGAGER